MKINKSFLTLIIGLLSYLYLIINIHTKIHFVFLYLLLLLFGYFFIENDIFLYAPIIIVIEVLKTNYYLEGLKGNGTLTIDEMVQKAKNDGSIEAIIKETSDKLNISDECKKSLEDEAKEEKESDCLTDFMLENSGLA